MDEILGSNVSKDYNRIGAFVKDRPLPVIPDVNRGGSFNNKNNAAYGSMENLKNRPLSSEK